MNQLGYIFWWVMQLWHLLGLIRSPLKSIWWDAVHCSAGLNVIPDTASEKIKTWLLPCMCRLQMNIMYQCGTWSWIRIWVDVVLHRHFNNYLPVNMVKLYILPIVMMVNSTYYLVLIGANTMCAGGEWDLIWVLWASQIHWCNVRASIAINHRLLVPWSISG